MKKIITHISCVLVIMLSASEANAQANPDGSQLSLFYSYAMPSGYLKDNLVSAGSPRGFGLSFSWKIAPKWRLGPSFGFQDFYEKGQRELFKPDPATDISAVVSHSIQTYPIQARATYLPTADKESPLQPFLSIGAGGAMINNRELWGMFDVINSVNFSLAFSAGAGVQYAIGQTKRTNLFAAVNYNYIPYNKFDIPTLNSINLQVGVTLRVNSNGRRSGDYYQQMPNPRMFNRM